MSNISDRISNLSSQEKRQLLLKLIQEKAQRAKANYPLSYGQQPFWLLYQLAPESNAANVLYVARLEGNLEIQTLQKAFALLIERHSILRTTYNNKSGEPMAYIHDEDLQQFQIIDVSQWSQQAIDNWIEKQGDRPFDLEQGPTIRVNLLTKSSSAELSDLKESFLVLVCHHIVLDFWSVEMLLNELNDIYLALKSNRKVSLNPLKRQYSDYVQWEADMLASRKGEQLWSYWKEQLAGDLPVLNLPIDKSRPPIQTYTGQSISFSFGKELTFRVREVAKANKSTPYVVILTAFELLLSRYTGQEEILVSSVLANRNLVDFEGICGYFVNHVVLRGELSGNPTFIELLGRVRQTVLQALEHKDFPFSLLVERLQPIRDASRPPIAQVGLSWDQLRSKLSPEKSDSDDKLIVETLISEPRGANLDLDLVIFDRGEVLESLWRYNPDLFDTSTIERMIRHFQTMLEAIVSDPQERITQLPMLTLDEQRQILQEWNNTNSNYPLNRCIHQLFEEQVQKTPDALAVVFEGEQLTYRELNNRANQLAYSLQRLGVKSEVLVGICIERSLEMVVGLLGIIKAGGAYVPLDPNYPSGRLDYMLDDSQVKILLTQHKLVNSLSNFSGKLFCLDTQWETVAQNPSANLVKTVNTDNLAYVIYTSGSTGKPKGVMNSHRGLVNRLLWMQEVYKLNKGDRVLQKTPFSFDVSIWEFFWPLITGATLVVAEPGGHQDTHYLVKIIAEQKITTLHFVPSMLQVFLEQQGVEACQSLKRVICSGEALPYELQKRFFERLNCELHNLYGPTEAAIDVTYWQCQPNSPLQKVPIGRPIANTKTYILDSYLQPVPIGVAGELHIGGVQLARGYWNRPELTEQKFIANPFDNSKVEHETSRLYKTGDLARYLPDGNIEYLGRIDHQVKIRGFRIELGEIEAILTQHPQVCEAIVLAEEDHTNDKRLVAYLVCQEAVDSTKELRDFLKQKLPDYMIPSAFVTLNTFPLTPNGKVDRRALCKLSHHQLDSGEAFVAPRNFIEEELVTIWRELLKTQQIGIYDNFFELGGHSLLLTQVASRIRSNFEVDVPLMLLFNTPTVVSMSIAITEKMLEQEEDTEQMIKEVQELSQSEIAALINDE